MSGTVPPPKPWEAAKAAATTTQGTGPKPWEQPQASIANQESTAIVPRTQPARPWEREGETTNALATTSAFGGTTGGLAGNYSSSLYSARPGVYGSNFGTGYGSGMYGSSTYGGGYRSGYGAGSMYGGTYGSSYGNSMYGGGYGSGYGSYGVGGGSMYGGGMYGSGGMYGTGGMYGGGGMYGAPGMPMPGGPMDPNHPPPQPPNAWQAFMQVINGVMHFFGRLSFLVDENTHAVHFFISALLQLLDRAGSLYAEIARFVLRLLFRKRAALAVKKAASAGAGPLVVKGASMGHGTAPGAPTAASVDTFGAAGAAFGSSAASGTVGAFLGGSQAFGLGGMPGGMPGAGAFGVGPPGASGPQWDTLWSR